MNTESRGFSDASAPIFVISVAAELAEMHPQTLRQYDRLGLVVPQRQGGGQRRYSRADLHRLRRIQVLSRDGVSLEGIRRIVELEREVDQLRQTVSHLIDQVNLLHDQGRFSRTFAAGATGDVTTRFTTPNDGSGTAAGRATGQTAGQPAERPTGQTAEQRGTPWGQRALETGVVRPKVLTWRRKG
ncbi:MAG: heat shock protein transcriptional repressor HspR [Micrococcaceae bacterium]